MPDAHGYAGSAVASSLSRETIHARLKEFILEAIERSGGPKALALRLRQMGFSYQEGTIRTWRGQKNPPAEVILAIAVATKDDVNLVEVLFKEEPPPSVSQRVARLEAQMIELLMGLGLSSAVSEGDRRGTGDIPNLAVLFRQVQELAARLSRLEPPEFRVAGGQDEGPG